MMRRGGAVAVLVGLLLAAAGWLLPKPAEDRSAPAEAPAVTASALGPQDQPVQKPRYDYMSTFLSRSTAMLGLRNDPASERLLKQPATKWALRAGVRHILW